MKLSLVVCMAVACCFTAVLFCGVQAGVADEPAADFFVSTRGSNTWSGTLAEPNAQQTDGPFASLERARDAVRALGKKKFRNVLVMVRGGTYRLDKTLVFGQQDSGRRDFENTYAAYPGETPVFSGGRPVEGWKKVTTALPGLPEKAKGKVYVVDVSGKFKALFDSQGVLPRARSAAFFPLEGSSRNRLHCPEGLIQNWANVQDIEIVVRPHHAWIVNILPLKSVDVKQQIAHTTIDSTYVMNKLHFLKETKNVWIENALEQLDQPGEWVLDSKAGKLYLWPREGSSESLSTVVAPGLTELIRVEGKINKQGPGDKPVRNLVFRGLSFMHGDRYTVASDDAGLQHDWDFHDKANALVRFRGSEKCKIEQCRFAHSGSGAIRVDLYGQENEIVGNEIEDMGGAGVLLCGYGPGTKDVNRKNLVYNNHIHHVGRIYSHSPGIMVWQSGENRVANNLIHHTPYTAIIVSGCMTEFFKKRGRELGRTIRRDEVGELPKGYGIDYVRPFLHSHDNAIEYNEIHHAMEVLGDGNAVYIRGAGAGNVIRRNYIHHLVAPMIMQAAIRTDGGQMDTTIVENLIYKCTSQGILIKLNTRCENNIVVDMIGPPRGYCLSVREGPLNGTIQRNVFYSTTEPCVFINELNPRRGKGTEDRRGRMLAKAMDADTDRNVYFCAANEASGKEMLQKQRADGVDVNSVSEDPLFVDPSNGDFRFKPGSPALKLGIVPFDMSKVGLVKGK